MSEITADWGGAQWVLATLWIIRLFFGPLARLVVGPATLDAWRAGRVRRVTPFWTNYGGMIMGDVLVMAILAWGGFW